MHRYYANRDYRIVTKIRSREAKDDFSERFLRTVERRVRDARLKYAGIPSCGGVRGRRGGSATAPAGVDRWPCTGDRAQEDRGGPLFTSRNSFSGITSIRVRLTAKIGSCLAKRFNLPSENELTQRRVGVHVLSTVTTESNPVFSLGSVYVPIK